MTVSAEQLSIIRKRIDQSHVTFASLRDDLVDHLCCAVEGKMGQGQDFDTAISDAVDELAPNGLKEIQNEAVFLLDSKVITMKKLIYVIGLIASSGVSMGIMFKLLHLPGGEQLVNYAFLTFILLFLPLYAFDRIQSKAVRTVPEKWQFVAGSVSALSVLLAVLFKMNMMLPPAEALFIVGMSTFSFGFLPFQFWKMYKSSEANRQSVSA